MRFACSLLFVGLVFVCTAVNSTYVPCYNCIDRATPSVLANIELRLYPNQPIGGYRNVLINNSLDLSDSIDPAKPTVVYISGWTESPDSASVKLIVGAYLVRQDHNILVVDWHVIAAQPYPYSALSVDGVGWTVANALNKLVAAGLTPSTLHMVGHSLGAQTCGFVGRYVNFKLPRITGLDPAGPGFGLVIKELTLVDATFVDVIHTDAGVFGTEFDLGTVNFRPNGGGSPQPGCALSGSLADACSHARSWMYYAESLLNENAFFGLKCSSYLEFMSRSCLLNIEVRMGYGTPSNASGKIYLQTNTKFAFGRGKDGETYTMLSDSLVTVPTL